MKAVITNEANKKMEEEIVETLDGIYNHVSGVLDTCMKLVDSASGKLANRLEDMFYAISDTELREMGGHMNAFDETYFYPVLANGIVPTWKSGYLQLYVRDNDGYRYETCALNGEILSRNDTRYNGYYINAADRDFTVIDLEHEANEITDEILNLMETIDKT